MFGKKFVSFRAKRLEDDMKNWYENVEFGFMMHFGLYSLLGGEHKGRKCDVPCEWIQNRMEIHQTFS